MHKRSIARCPAGVEQGRYFAISGDSGPQSTWRCPAATCARPRSIQWTWPLSALQVPRSLGWSLPQTLRGSPATGDCPCSLRFCKLPHRKPRHGISPLAGDEEDPPPSDAQGTASVGAKEKVQKAEMSYFRKLK